MKTNWKQEIAELKDWRKWNWGLILPPWILLLTNYFILMPIRKRMPCESHFIWQISACLYVDALIIVTAVAALVISIWFGILAYRKDKNERKYS